ncbi:hypothetical protein GCM10025865_08870 [Paraoerskovia sediminicola]|uniref:DUF3151 domain-containing protein n=1 Tax=Paraoerskovia sediminicola TaxID=1138587 RepID=A0ABN6XDQ1_9CELL|nr:DUF3151 domain-containing protein [Paraoerskovia sediminicola]BDZ41588.1 hypothetical protein GCM10025865_08870 [Paraoerskovia sediminicola]
MTDTPSRPAPARDLLSGPAPTLLGDDHPDLEARSVLEAGTSVDDAARRFPASSYVWAVLAEQALDADDPVAAYAYARTGYHRGLDALRRAGWRGQGPIPAEHRANQGFLRAMLALADAAEEIQEEDEAARCRQFLADSGTSEDEVRTLR